MEWLAFVAGEPHTDHPVCVSPVLQSFCIAFNDVLDDERRQRLRPYLTRCIGTAGDGLDEQRAWMATDWLIRTFTPAWLDLAGLHSHASNLRSLAEVVGKATLEDATPTLDAARTAAAARAAAGDAAWAVARDAAGDVAWAVARAAARAVAWAAAWAAAGAAVGDAARDAAGDAAQPTVDALQRSAFELLDRMLPTEPLVLPTLVVEARELCEGVAL